MVKITVGLGVDSGLDPIFMAPGDKPGEVMRAGSDRLYLRVLLGAYPMVLLLTRWF